MNRSLLRILVCTVTLAVAIAPRCGFAASLEPAAWRGDARFLVAAVDSIHPRPYHWNRRAAWDSAAGDLEARLPTMRYDQAVAGFSRLLGMLRDGHSRLDQLELPSHGRPTLMPLPGPGFGEKYPVDFEVFADGLWIIAATAPHSDLCGAHVVAINGTPVERAVAALTSLIPADNPMWTLNALPAFLRSPGYVSAAGLSRDPAASILLTLTDSRGRRREARVSPEPPDSAARWVAADGAVRFPLPVTRSLSGPFAFADLADSARTVFVRIRAIVDEPGKEHVAPFVARLFAHVDSLGSRRLILDLRGNGGGNNYLNQPLVHAVIRRPELDRTGGLFVIVDRGTFSAAVSLAADLQRETHALFVGEPTGLDLKLGLGFRSSLDLVLGWDTIRDGRDHYAHVTLPASGLIVRISTVLWQGSDPRDPRAFIAPDLPVMQSFGDWMAHRDPALAAIDAYRPLRDAADTPPNTHWGSRSRLQAQVPPIAW